VAVAKCSISTLMTSNPLQRAWYLTEPEVHSSLEVRSSQGHVEQLPTDLGCEAMSRSEKESQMPKLKTKSGAKKRFKVTGTGKVLYAQSGKRHGMIKRTTKQIRDHRGTAVLFKTDGDRIKKYWLPNA
jgi:large subunit ribosomal protein L35